MLRLERKIKPEDDTTTGWRLINLETGEDLLPKLKVTRIKFDVSADGRDTPMIMFECIGEDIDIELWEDETSATIRELSIHRENS